MNAGTYIWSFVLITREQLAELVCCILASSVNAAIIKRKERETHFLTGTKQFFLHKGFDNYEIVSFQLVDK